ncbi:uncharacterized protein VTP21DRAFT_2928 [Calcarisporiella thermophila]|uniref:uncharacterized protein n=1 Tax=Calcarisporiella thermophila TaxID=911321 RepID=UPI0037426246
MQMLTKFESKSNRVKGIAFHPKRPWILAALHNGCIQLWDYRMGTLLERFDEHDGPVRGIAFHPTQPLFVSGGDDYKIKVWNYKTRRCLFTLNGHLDYVRTVFFHHECPWIVSASDDQTVRIWNWQSRSCIAILTGHNHYVMCAQFHPKEDLVVSASLDQTVRVWDVSGLRKKGSSPGLMQYEDAFQRAGAPPELFGSLDVVVKYVLEGHDRGVNWAAFHPSLPLIASCGDDRQVKLWRMNDSKAWEVDSCRGHFNNVSCVLFHPRQDLIISNGEDKTIRVWDMSKRTAVQTFRREHDRFWVMAVHPELNLFAAGHDNGLIVFKLERERPAYAVHQNSLFYIKDKYLHVHDFSNGSDNSVLSVRRLGNQYTQPRSLSYNPAERAVLVTTSAEGGLYELFNLPRDFASGEPREPSDDQKRGPGSSAIFIARNRFAVLDKINQQIHIKDLSNATTKSVKPPAQVNEIFYAGTGNLLLSTPNSVILYDIQQRKTLAELSTPPVKYVVWSADMNMVALLSKHTITIANKLLEQSSLIHETIRIKSGAWDDVGIFVYSTLNHIKYALPQGDHGIIRTLEHPVYLTRVKGKSVHILDRDANARVITIDPTEYRFKLALIKRNYDEVLYIIRNSNLVGQAIIAYLQKKGYPEIALHFVRDDKTRFDLALECGNLEVALETAKAMDREDCWSRLAKEALRQGNFQIVEKAYQRTKSFDRLSFLYLISGSTDKLRKMMKIAELHGDQMLRFHNALYLGDVEERLRLLKEVGQLPLAYLTAKAHGMAEEAESILATADLTPEDVEDYGGRGDQLVPPEPVVRLEDNNWPLLSVPGGSLANAFAAAAENQPPVQGVGVPQAAAAMLENVEDAWGAEEDLIISGGVQLVTSVGGEPAGMGEEALDVDAGWGFDPDLKVQLEAEAINGAAQEAAGDFVAPTPGQPESALWVQNSPLAADHVAAGSFETAMQILNRQVGAVNFTPLKPHFMAMYQATRAAIPGNISMPPLVVPIRRNPDEQEVRRSLPAQINSLQRIVSQDLQSAYALTKAGKFQDATVTFKKILHSLLLLVTEADKVDEVHQLVNECREYLVGLAIVQEQRSLPPEETKRALELAALFTHCQLKPAHMLLSLRNASTACFKAKNFATASLFARRLLELNPPPNVSTQIRQMLAVCERTPRDIIPLDYDQHAAFVISAGSHTALLRGASGDIVHCPYCRANYEVSYNGSLCQVCEIAQVGANSTGLKVSL